ncbi:MAG: hypothetical protein ACYCY0_13685 [Acidithiobacillus ferrivorans]
MYLIAGTYATHKRPTVQEWLATHPHVLHTNLDIVAWLKLVERFSRDIITQRPHREIFCERSSALTAT